MECLFKSEHFLISVPGAPLSLSGLRAGLREGAAVSGGDLNVDLQLAVVVHKTSFPNLLMKKLARLRVLATNSADKPVTAILHDGGNLFRSLRFAGF